MAKKPQLEINQLYAVPCAFDDVVALVRVDQIECHYGATRKKALLSSPPWLNSEVPTLDALEAVWPSGWKTMHYVPVNHVPSWWTLVGEVPVAHRPSEPADCHGFAHADFVGSGSFFWDQLSPDAAPRYRCSKQGLSVEGPRQTLDLEGRISLSWRRHERTSIDLADVNHLSRFVVTYGEGLETIRLSAINTIAFDRSGPGAPPTVTLPNARAVDLWFSPDAFCAVPGLEKAKAIRIHSISGELDLRCLKSYTHLRSLTLEFDGGTCSSLQHLADAPSLRIIRILDFFELDPAELPPINQLPNLGTLTFDGVRKEHVQEIRTRYQPLRNLEVRHVRSQHWIAENQKNPLRNWQDMNLTVGKRAAKAWLKARRDAHVDGPEPAIRNFLDVLNRMADTLPIESVERDDAGLAVEMIGLEHGVAIDVVRQWFEECRDF